jgi:hypothetical protein
MWQKAHNARDNMRLTYDTIPGGQFRVFMNIIPSVRIVWRQNIASFDVQCPYALEYITSEHDYSYHHEFRDQNIRSTKQSSHTPKYMPRPCVARSRLQMYCADDKLHMPIAQLIWHDLSRSSIYNPLTLKHIQMNIKLHARSLISGGRTVPRMATLFAKQFFASRVI